MPPGVNSRKAAGRSVEYKNSVPFLPPAHEVDKPYIFLFKTKVYIGQKKAAVSFISKILRNT